MLDHYIGDLDRNHLVRDCNLFDRFNIAGVETNHHL